MSFYSDSLVYCCHPLVYICDRSNKRIAVVDIADEKQTMQISCGEDSDPYGIAMSPNSSCAYVANYISKTIQKLDLTHENKMDTKKLSNSPKALAVSPCGGFLYVVFDTKPVLLVMDTHTLEEVSSISLPAPASSITVVPNGRTAYLTLPTLDQTAAVDLQSHAVIHLLKSGSFPNHIVSARTVPTVLEAGQDSESLILIDSFNNVAKEEVSLDSAPSGIAFINGEQHCLVSLKNENKAAVIDLYSKKITNRIPVGSLPGSVAASKAYPLAVVCNEGDSTLSIINTNTAAVTATVTIGGCASGAVMVG